MPRLYIGGLSLKVTSEKLHKQFSAYGEVTGIEIKEKKGLDGNIITRFSYLNLDGNSDVIQNCITDLNGAEWKGEELKVALAKESFLEKLKREREQNRGTNLENNYINSEPVKPFDRTFRADNDTFHTNFAEGKREEYSSTFRNEEDIYHTNFTEKKGNQWKKSNKKSSVEDTFDVAAISSDLPGCTDFVDANNHGADNKHKSMEHLRYLSTLSEIETKPHQESERKSNDEYYNRVFGNNANDQGNSYRDFNMDGKEEMRNTNNRETNDQSSRGYQNWEDGKTSSNHRETNDRSSRGYQDWEDGKTSSNHRETNDQSSRGYQDWEDGKISSNHRKTDDPRSRGYENEEDNNNNQSSEKEDIFRTIKRFDPTKEETNIYVKPDPKKRDPKSDKDPNSVEIFGELKFNKSTNFSFLSLFDGEEQVKDSLQHSYEKTTNEEVINETKGENVEKKSEEKVDEEPIERIPKARNFFIKHDDPTLREALCWITAPLDEEAKREFAKSRPELMDILKLRRKRAWEKTGHERRLKSEKDKRGRKRKLKLENLPNFIRNKLPVVEESAKRKRDN